MRLIDPERVVALMRAVAKEAILPRFRNLKPGETREKGPNDLVTVADLESEKLLTAELVAMLPGSVVVGEEAVAASVAVLDRLEGEAPVWILDPVDGTLMFARGSEQFAVIVALVDRGRTVAGWILDPVGDHVLVAEEGAGAWLDGRRMRIAGGKPPAAMTGVAWGTAALAKRVGARVGKSLAWGSAGRAYMALAAGELDFMFARSLKPWDHAAGDLIHREAGGHAALFDGTPYRPVPLSTQFLAAPDLEGWTALRGIAGGDG